MAPADPNGLSGAPTREFKPITDIHRRRHVEHGAPVSPGDARQPHL
jgi:hypothetical protein